MPHLSVPEGGARGSIGSCASSASVWRYDSLGTVISSSEGANEHEIIERQLQKLSAAGDKTSEQWTAEMKVLSELVEHHVDEEESTGFSCAREDFGKDELEAMAQRFQTRKAQLMTRVA
jgi:hypothetical protein